MLLYQIGYKPFSVLLRNFEEKLLLCLFLPEAGGDVFEITLGGLAIEALVGGGFLQGAEVANVRANLDVIEVLLVDG